MKKGSYREDLLLGKN